ncbi:pentatricopeptide repeat-containing protein At2g36240 [Impatiens glandulifera]|uniref:pentatricopeptide repeat-containing protein At2g36240 n=1 Tax=Impatiens glandulifera TaxID=253017 RepID=UPI001FB0ECF7|nr:pentatricopeptide repeat-containing protein At2g36240 [Impatiens glandulifera]
MVLKNLLKPRLLPSPVVKSGPSDLSLLPPPPEFSPLPHNPTLSLSSAATHTQLTHFLETHLKPSFTPKHLLSFLKNRLRYHTKFAHLDLHIFRHAASIDSFRHDHSTFEWMVRTLAVTDRFEGLGFVLQFMVSNPCPCSDGIFSCSKSESTFRFAINSYCRVGRLNDALITFDYMKKTIDGLPSVDLYNILIHGFVKHNQHVKACELYSRMIKERVKPDVFTFNILISSYCRNRQFESALEMFKEMRVNGCSPTVVSFNTLIKGFFREKKFNEGIRLAYEMIELGYNLSRVTCEILIGALSGVNQISESCNLVKDLSKKGALPSDFDYFELIEKLCEKGNVEKAKDLVEQLWSNGNVPSLISCTTLIEGLRKSGKIEEAAAIMEKMFKEDNVVPDIVTYNCLIRDMCDRGRSIEANALRLLGSLKGLEPDGTTYSNLVLGYTKEGKKKEGCLMIEEMLDKGFIPDIATYNRFMDGLSKNIPHFLKIR